ncbi:MAG: hypothetical protein HFJ29_05210 [Clostridia bacterium]|nr:hypothetical protein [Clostridia bacterium]
MKKSKKGFKNLLSNFAFTLFVIFICLAMESPFLLMFLPDKKEGALISLILTVLMAIFISYLTLSSSDDDNIKL